MAHDPDLVADFYQEDRKEEESLEEVIEHRAVFLAGYQDTAYANRYRASLEALRSQLPTEQANELTLAAARSLFKLMAYKDEFEVARLMTGTHFEEQIAQEFDGDFKVNFHMAPPLLSRRKDARGRPEKKSFGPWLRPVLSLLARGRSLRGSRLNPFGYHEEARLHRDLLGWYEDILTQAASTYSAEQHQQWLEVLSAPMEIRGYGPVRLQVAKKERTKADALMQKLAAKND